MRFVEVVGALKEGKKIKLEKWKNAYWYEKDGVLINHDEDGIECPTTEILPYSLVCVCFGNWEIVAEKLTPMDFKEAFKLMKQGYSVKLPSWGGYWYWDATKETIVIHTKDGRELDIRETKRVEYTTLNILSNEWVLASPTNCPAMGGEATFSFGEAIKYLKRGHKVARNRYLISTIHGLLHPIVTTGTINRILFMYWTRYSRNHRLSDFREIKRMQTQTQHWWLQSVV